MQLGVNRHLHRQPCRVSRGVDEREPHRRGSGARVDDSGPGNHFHAGRLVHRRAHDPRRRADLQALDIRNRHECADLQPPWIDDPQERIARRGFDLVARIVQTPRHDAIERGIDDRAPAMTSSAACAANAPSRRLQRRRSRGPRPQLPSGRRHLRSNRSCARVSAAFAFFT